MNRLHFFFFLPLSSSHALGARRRAFGQPCGTSSLEPAAKEADADPRGDPSKQ
jgi:hypothetical protein